MVAIDQKTHDPVTFAGGVLDRYRHVCAFVNSRDEEHRFLVPFVSEGVAHGDKLLYIVDSADRATLVRHLRHLGLDMPTLLGQKQCEVRSPSRSTRGTPIRMHLASDLGASDMSTEPTPNRRRILGAAAATIAAAVTIVAVKDGTIGVPIELAAEDASGELAALSDATAWLNSPPLTAADLIGKVALVEFWTYTCIYWLRAQPYVRAWAETYQEHGLVVIGVHAPEFPFEHDLDNVRRAASDLDVTYPIAIDNDFAIWRAFDNHYWPALYVIDATGRIRHHQFGEGGYEQSERIIQQLLAEAGATGLGDELVSVAATGREAPADWDNLRTPETYVGYELAEHFASPGGAAWDEPRVYSVPPRLDRNQWALAGDWTVRSRAAGLNAATGRIAFRFHARDLHLVLGPATKGDAVRFRVSLDGQPPGAGHGIDVDEHGVGTVSEQRLYHLIRQPGPIADRTFEIALLDPGLEAYAFTFG